MLANTKRKSPWLGIGLIALAVFFALCWRYATRINLWGDEALSLLYASYGWSLVPTDVHLPTYNWLLAVVLAIWGDRQETLLRLLHVIPFAVGLGFGLTTVYRTWPARRLVGIVAAIAVTLPSYIFYATNIRMYALIFMASMMFIDAVSRVLAAGANPSRAQLIWLGVSGAILVSSDYTAALYYGAGVLMLALQAMTQKTRQALVVVMLPGLLLLGLALATLGNLREIQNWNMAGYQGPGWTGLTGLAKGIYLACRPALDLVNQAPLPVALALGLPVLLLGSLGLATWALFRRTEARLGPTDWLLLLALLWVPFIPTGFSFTRLFLPSQFFMVAVMAWWALNGASRLRYVGLATLGLLFMLNLGEALNPTPKPYSLVPYRTIAAEVVEYSQQQGIDRVLLGNNSLNTLSIQRYIQQLVDADQLQTERVGSEDLVAALNQGEPFIFVSHRGESGGFIGVDNLPSGNPQPLGTYVPIEALPYNRLWRQRYLEGAGQPFMIQTYRLN